MAEIENKPIIILPLSMEQKPHIYKNGTKYYPKPGGRKNSGRKKLSLEQRAAQLESKLNIIKQQMCSSANQQATHQASK
jgi:hypothetical protein